MNLGKVLDVAWFARLVLVIWLVSSVFVLFLLGRIDGLVHGRLYDFGLVFSYDWAVPYWLNLRLIYVCLGLPAVLSGFVLVYGLFSSFRGSEVPVVQVKKQAVERVKGVEGKTVRRSVEVQAADSMLFACSSCGKRFSKPLLMLDFSGGKGRLVNVCPFCGAKLGGNNSGDGVEKEFEVRFGEEEEVKREEK